jgi:hypothetical protein
MYILIAVALSLGLKWPEREVDCSFNLVLTLECSCIFTRPVRLRGWRAG